MLLKGGLRRALYAGTASQQETRLTNGITIIPEERSRSFSLFIQGNKECKWVQAAVDKHVEKRQYKAVGTNLSLPSNLTKTSEHNSHVKVTKNIMTEERQQCSPKGL